jgi:hypothetical protein
MKISPALLLYAQPLAVERLGWDAAVPLTPLLAERTSPVVVVGAPASERWAAMDILASDPSRLWDTLLRGGDPAARVDAGSGPLDDGDDGYGEGDDDGDDDDDDAANDGGSSNVLRGVQVSDDARLTYEREQTGTVFGEARGVAQRVDMRVTEFARAVLSGGARARYSGALAAHPHAWGAFGGSRLAGMDGYCGASAADPEVNLWISGAHTITALHYDTSANFFTQVLGRKRFLLFPPQIWSDAGTFPDAHRRSRQCPRVPTAAANQSTTDTDAHSDAMSDTATAAGSSGEASTHHQPHSDRALEVILEPGEVLFLPSHWFHEVEALDGLTVSVNAWCPNPLVLAVAEVFAAGNADGKLMPIAAEWEPQQRVIGLFHFVTRLSRRVLGAPNVEGFFERMYTARYAHLDVQPPDDEDNAYAYDLCHAEDIGPLREALKPQMAPLFKGPVARIAKPFRTTPVSRRYVWIWDFVFDFDFFFFFFFYSLQLG